MTRGQAKGSPAKRAGTARGKPTGQVRPPGGPSREEAVARMIRVDHAGEYGAVRIYEGQLSLLGATAAAEVIREMAEQERAHRAYFEKLIVERRVRPTALTPLWHVAGYVLGAATAALSARAAMACTVAVEEVIDEHYARQARALGDNEAALRGRIEEFRCDEIAHRDTALEHGAREAPGYMLLSGAIKAGTKLAIWLSTRI